ncbi:MAG: hypothetical protein K6G58_05345 [Lachnospiraceae bacterium]|nr:hypothetical protein [Lachnospiraceae bacterium]
MRLHTAALFAAAAVLFTGCANISVNVTVPGKNLSGSYDEAVSTSEESEADYLGILPDHVREISTEGCDTFTQIVDRVLTQGQGYANVRLGDTDVLAVAGATFSGYGEDAAVDAEIFRYADDGTIEYLGYLQCGGTANPLAVKDGMVYTAGHHYVGKHTVTDGKLVTIEEAWETYDGSRTFCRTYSDGKESVSEGSEADAAYSRLFDECFGADIIAFDTIK